MGTLSTAMDIHLFYLNHHSLFLPNHLTNYYTAQTRHSMPDLIQSLMINHLSTLCLHLITRHQSHQHQVVLPVSLPEPKQLGFTEDALYTIIRDTSSRFSKSGGGKLKKCSLGQRKHHYQIRPQVGSHSILRPTNTG